LKNSSYSFQSFFFFFSLFPSCNSASHRSEQSELSIGEQIEEDLSTGVDDINTSDKVWGYVFPIHGCLCLLSRKTVENCERVMLELTYSVSVKSFQ
jgi:hypothetical protein